ncbi:hypothetical protein ACJRO7_033828 [Eucalyptus globulus]|uniref:tRNA (guanine(46)-N(7))-methyltransferase n=1 Tax=Eucalyptus globulus TaxID=34317 RepID=A0ABD3J1B9_EUCGL
MIEKETTSTFNKLTAHSNPLSDSHFPVPLSRSQFDYSLHYPPLIQFADIGCGFRGLLVALSTVFPDKLMIGMEIRDKVTEYVKERISTLRTTNPHQYQNISIVSTESASTNT